MVTESAGVGVIAAGGIAALLAMLSTDLNLIMVLIVGLVGGCIFFFKKWANLEVKSTRLKTFAEFVFTVPLAMSTAGVVYYFGTKGVNPHIDFGSAMWIFLALMGALYHDKVIPFFTERGAKKITKEMDKDS